MSTATQQTTPMCAPLWLRLAAGLYDLLPLFAIWFLTAAVSLFITHGTLETANPPLWYRTLLLAATASYFVLSWIRGGQTIGMKPWRLKLQRLDGAPLTAGQALLRFLVALLSLLAFGLGFLWALYDSERRTWHDLAAKTMLIKTRVS